MAITLPPFLQPGDPVGITAPAGNVQRDALLKGLKVLRENWQLNVAEGAVVYGAYYQYAGTDAARRDDLQRMLDNPELKAIFAVRGGYGCSRLVDQLDFTTFKKYPKWLVGFSDLTVLLSHLLTLGYASVHGPMVKQLGDAAISDESLRRLLFGEPVSYETGAHSYNRPGIATGVVTGGNLCLLAHLTGSVSETDTSGSLLFLEDVGEPLYNLDRMMLQLKRAGKLSGLAGLIAGQFSELKDGNDRFGMSAYEIIQEHTRDYDYPVAYDFPAGHVADNRALLIGGQARLEVTPGHTRLTFVLSPSA